MAVDECRRKSLASYTILAALRTTAPAETHLAPLSGVWWARSGARQAPLRCRSRTGRAKLRPQLPCWCREHMPERPRSKERRRPQLCAKPPLQRLAARHPSASRLPSFRRRKSQLTNLARFPGPVWRMRSLRVARRRIWPQQEAVDRPKLAIEPGRTGAQRSSRHARAARPHFPRTIPTWWADVRTGRG